MLRKTDPQSIAPYLRDASNFSGGNASEVLIPETLQELTDFLKTNSDPITVAGAGTGLTASRIPLEGKIVSLEKFKQLGEVEEGTIVAGPAVSLKDLREHLLQTGWFYPPNPTESLASLGGTLATNASGSRSYKFGVTRDYVLEAQIVLADGRTVRLKRGHTIDGPLHCDDGSRIAFPKVNYQSPQCKNAAGYYVQPGMDWIDVFVGSDGTLCLFTEVRLKLLEAPAKFLSGVLFFKEEVECWNIVEDLKKHKTIPIHPCSLEYFDTFSLQRLKSKFNRIPESAKAALFFEQDIARADDYDSVLEAWYEYLESQSVSLDDSWFAQSPKDVERFHEFRHELPLIINEENSRRGRVKMGTDMAVDDGRFMDMMSFYREALAGSGMDYVMFGHIGDNHLHINLLPDDNQRDEAKNLYHRLVDQVLQWNGTISAEHGVGKLKKDFYWKMVGQEGIEELKTIKHTLDPRNLLGRGNLI